MATERAFLSKSKDTNCQIRGQLPDWEVFKTGAFHGSVTIRASVVRFANHVILQEGNKTKRCGWAFRLVCGGFYSFFLEYSRILYAYEGGIGRRFGGRKRESRFLVTAPVACFDFACLD